MHLRADSRSHGWWLWCLLGLFVIRVIAQPLSLFVESSYLPAFDAWHSGALPYWALGLSQLLVIAVFAFLAWTVSSVRVAPRRRVGIVMLVLGGTYFVAMLARLALGATILNDQHWFARPLPTVFHLVLASFLLVYGHFHARYGSKD